MVITVRALAPFMAGFCQPSPVVKTDRRRVAQQLAVGRIDAEGRMISQHRAPEKSDDQAFVLALRRPIEERKDLLKKLIGNTQPGIAFNKHFDIEGTVLFHHACKLGREGIVSKRIGSPYRFGRSNDWIKVKNPAASAVKREAEEDWRTLGRRLR
jgi:ATP dependent DNA ligase domain